MSPWNNRLIKTPVAAPRFDERAAMRAALQRGAQATFVPPMAATNAGRFGRNFTGASVGVRLIHAALSLPADLPWPPHRHRLPFPEIRPSALDLGTF
jgi:hypothetical protein